MYFGTRRNQRRWCYHHVERAILNGIQSLSNIFLTKRERGLLLVLIWSLAANSPGSRLDEPKQHLIVLPKIHKRSFLRVFGISRGSSKANSVSPAKHNFFFNKKISGVQSKAYRFVDPNLFEEKSDANVLFLAQHKTRQFFIIGPLLECLVPRLEPPL